MSRVQISVCQRRKLLPVQNIQKREQGSRTPNLENGRKGRNLRLIKMYDMLSAFFLSTYCFH
jgi:hypothetical protein